MKDLPKVKYIPTHAHLVTELVRFHRAAVEAGWPEEDLAAVIQDAQSGDRNHLICTLFCHAE